jgi:hypothetical protein
MEALKLQRNISYGSILPIIVFISGLLVIYFFSSQLFAEGMITMLFSSIFYIIMAVIRSTDVNPPTQFNLILENISTFMTFGISSIMFGVMFYAPNVDILFIMFIYFFAIACVFSVARNWEYDIREALGMPLAFNGIFFPLFYYMFRFYFNDLGDSIFLLYYLITGILTLSNFKFLWFDEKYIKDKNKYSNYYSKVIEEDKLIQQRIKQREQKSFNNSSKQSSNKDKIEKYDIKKEILEDSILDKLKKIIINLVSKKDQFNTISGMPTLKELDETLPHTAKDSQSNKKNGLFSKIVSKIFFKSGKSYDNYSIIKGMPNEKELQETLSKSDEVKVKKDMINKLSYSSNKQKKSEPVLDKIIKFITRKFKSIQVDNFSVISGMPTIKELDETLPHTAKDSQPNKKKGVFSKIVNKIFFKSRKSDDNFSVISGMPNEKELKETLSKSDEVKVKEDMINKISYSSNKQKKSEPVLDKIFKFITRKLKSMRVDNFNVISGMPDEKELQETLIKSDSSIEIEKKIDKKAVKVSDENKTKKVVKNDLDLVGGNNSISSIKPKFQNVQISSPKYEKIESLSKSEKVLGIEDSLELSSQKEDEEVFVEPNSEFNKANLNNPNNSNYIGNKAEVQEVNDYDEDYDYEQEIDFDYTLRSDKKESLTKRVSDVYNLDNSDEEFDLDGFDNDYVERK